MSEKLLNALMELFAIVANIDKIHDRGRRTVSLFLKQQLSLDDVKTYLDKYDEYYLKHSGGSDEKKRTSVNHSVLGLLICQQINEEITMAVLGLS